MSVYSNVILEYSNVILEAVSKIWSECESCDAGGTWNVLEILLHVFWWAAYMLNNRRDAFWDQNRELGNWCLAYELCIVNEIQYVWIFVFNIICNCLLDGKLIKCQKIVMES